MNPIPYAYYSHTITSWAVIGAVLFALLVLSIYLCSKKRKEEKMSEYRRGGARCGKCGAPVWWEDSTPNCKCVTCLKCGASIPEEDSYAYRGSVLCADCFFGVKRGKKIPVGNSSVKPLG